MNVLSLFDGMSCGMIALERAGIKVENYYASEIDKYAIEVSNKNYPNIIRLGDVKEVCQKDLPKIDLLIGGSPCQGFSFAGKQLNFDDPRSALFFEFVNVLRKVRSYNSNVKFLLENVKMKKESENVITELLGVKPTEINSNLVSAQNRKRLYWTNIEGVMQPEDRKIFLSDVIFNDTLPVCLHNIYGGFNEKKPRVFIGKSPSLRANSGGGSIPSLIKESLIHSKKAIDYMNRLVKDGRSHWDFMHHSDVRNEKSSAMVANFFKGVPYNVLKDWDCIRAFHPIECERLQTIPDNYTQGVSNTQRYKMIGNGWTVDVIAHIFKSIKY